MAIEGRGANRNAIDVFINHEMGVVPNAFQGDNPFKFVICAICKPILASKIKFEKLEVRWNPEDLPNLCADINNLNQEDS